MPSPNEQDRAELQPEDARALDRLMRRTLAKGFRLVVIEVETPRQRQHLLVWIRARTEALAGRVRELDLGGLARENLWSELVQELGDGMDERAGVVLALHGFEDLERDPSEGRKGIYRQLNVQRDLFVRDLGCFWILFVHPDASRRLQDVAPDFCDFASLWIRVGRPSVLAQSLRLTAPSRQVLGEILLNDDDDDDEQQSLLAEAIHAVSMGRHVDARDLLTRFDLARTGPSEHDGAALRLRSWLELSRGKLDAARKAAEQALAWERDRDEQGREGEALALTQLAGVLNAHGELTEARSLLERALELQLSVYGTEFHPSVAASLRQLGNVLLALGQTSEARRLLERSLEMKVSGYGDSLHPSVVASLHDLGQAQRLQGDLDGSRRTLERSLEIEVELYGSQLHPSVAQTLQSLAGVLQEQGDLDGARRHLERALEIQSKVLGTQDHPEVATSMHGLGSLLHAQGDLDGARRQLERALEIQAKVLGTEFHPAVAGALYELGSVFRDQGSLVEAGRLFERALGIQLRVYGRENHPDVGTTLHSLGLVSAEQGKLDEATVNYERALAIDVQLRGTREHHEVAKTEVALAQVLFELGEHARALALVQHARPILLDIYGSEDRWVRLTGTLLEREASSA